MIKCISAVPNDVNFGSLPDPRVREFPMLKIQVLLLVALLVCCKAYALDEFDGVKCGSDIPKALVGKRASNGRVVVIEGRHKELGLKDLGGIEISDQLFLVSWLICGNEFELLLDTKSSLIRDVLLFPAHSASSPEFIGDCQINGNAIPEAVIAVLNNSAGYNAREGQHSKTLLQATAAWKVDEPKERFVLLSTAGLACPMEQIVTLDGGP